MRFIGNRIVIALITLLLVSVLSFCAFHLIPGDAALLSLGIEADEVQLAALRSEWGLDRSVPVQYLSWLGKLFSGNLGNSSRFRGASVSSLILDRLPVTSSLALLSLFFILLIAVPVALLPSSGTAKKNTFLDSVINTWTALNISMPGFFIGIVFIWIFGLTLRFFVPGAYIDYRINQAAFWSYLIFPALAIAMPNAAILVKFLRTSITREMNSSYVRTARSKGAGSKRILYRHVIKNACIPALAIFGMIIGEVFSGSIVMEQVFSIPGIGRLLIASITSRDYMMVETLVVYIAFAVILANTLADIAIQIIDPRIRLGIAPEKS
ncbi:MAG: ABC transporter permease [Treponema sp.]|jgi:ABC-type dipeptide/oligopeptide/nickel transport system permease component|nr:ABC transporter permease [Treponema sp.]